MGIVYTSLALDYFHNGNRHNVAQPFIDYVNSVSMPEIELNFSSNNVNAYLTESKTEQRTPSISVTGSSDYCLTINLQSGVTLVNETRGTQNTGNVNVYGGDTFYLKAPLNINGSWTSSPISNCKYKYQSILFRTSSSSMQDLASGVIAVEDPSRTISLSVNWLTNGNIKIVKIDNKGTAVSGIKIKLSYNADMSNPIGTYTTANDGTIKVNDLRVGTIYYQEVETREHLVLDNTIKSATIIAGETTQVGFTNQWKQGYIQVTKIDSVTGQIVKKAGTVFEILQNSTVVTTITTNENGVATSGLLDYGTYTVREKTAPQNYTKATVNQSVKVVDATIATNMSNKPVTGKIILTKSDAETGNKAQGNATLVGAKYTLKANENILNPANGEILFSKGEIISNKKIGSGNWGDTGTKIVDSNYQITWSNLPMGTYIIEETTAPTGYLLDSNHIVTLSSTSSETPLEIKDVSSAEQVKKGYIQVTKKDIETGKTVKKAGVEFEILFENKVISVIKTNANGIAKSGLLPYGTYIVREKLAPNKYIITDITKTVNVYENNKVYEIEIANKQVEGKVSIVKEDTITGNQAQGEATLEGAIYGVYARNPILDPADDTVLYSKDEKVTNLITNEKAQASADKLYLGEYYIKEIKASNGYNLDTTKYNFDLTYENQNVSIVMKNATVKERVISQPFQIIKVSSNEAGEAELLEGSEFTIKAQKDIDKFGSWEKAPIAKNANGETASILRTDSKGYAMSDRLPFRNLYNTRDGSTRG